MGKEDLFSKFKNYDNELEKILEDKQYTEDAKNLLLSMFYKIEAAYRDYEVVKYKELNKNEYIKEILNMVENQCDEIQFAKPKSKDAKILESKNVGAIVEIKNKKIICYPTEKALLYGLNSINPKSYSITNFYSILRPALLQMLNMGSDIEGKEILRDFNGWAWSIEIDEIENIEYNLIYQDMRLLVGRKFLLEWEKNEEARIDYILKMKEILTEKYGAELTQKIWNIICKMCLLILANANEEEKIKMLNSLEDAKIELEKMTNKVEYLLDLANKKKEIERNIKIIDTNINDTEKLKQEYIKRTEEEQDLENIDELVKVLKNERQQLIENLKIYNDIMDPRKFVKRKEELEEKIDLISNLNLRVLSSENELMERVNIEKEEREILFQSAIELQKNVINALETYIDNATTKEEIVSIIYKYRYLLYLPIKKQTHTMNVSELEKDIKYSQERLVKKACQMKVLAILNKDEEKNSEIISKILNTTLVNLSNIEVQFKIKEGKIQLEIYDGNVLDKCIEIESLSNINIKLNKKTKLFA